VPGLRRVTATINGTNITLLSSGYLARALGRTGWTVRHWIKLGLLPPAPFVISPDVPGTRRPLYPEQYLDALTEIAWRLRIGSRMDYANRRSFHAEVARAYEEIVVPLRLVIPPPAAPPVQNRGTQDGAAATRCETPSGRTMDSGLRESARPTN
jgi:hypothetical protein